MKLINLVLLAMFTISCSNSKFTDKKKELVKADKSSTDASVNKEGQKLADDYIVDQNGVHQKDGKYSEFAADSFGCQLPKEFSEKKTSSSLALGWGSSGRKKGPSAAELKRQSIQKRKNKVLEGAAFLNNVDINTCKWFEANKKDQKAKLMLVYDEKDQSFVTPLRLDKMIMNKQLDVCFATITKLEDFMKKNSLKGSIRCSILPKDTKK